MTERVSFGSRRPIEMSVIQPTTQRSHFCTRDMSRADYVQSPPDLATSPPSWAAFFLRQPSRTPKGNLGQKVPKQCSRAPKIAAFTIASPQSRFGIVSGNLHQIGLESEITTLWYAFSGVVSLKPVQHCFKNAFSPADYVSEK